MSINSYPTNPPNPPVNNSDSFEGKTLCDKYFETVKSTACQELDNEVLLPIIQMTLKHPCVIESLCKQDETYKNYYNEHYIRDKITFVMLDKDASFSMCILMSKYH